MVLFIFTFEATIVKSFFGTARLTLFARPASSRLHRNSCGRHGAGQTAVSDDVVESTNACANTADRNFVRRGAMVGLALWQARPSSERRLWVQAV